MILLHGLFGTISNWTTVLDYFSKRYRVMIPSLPIYEGDRKYTSIEGLLSYVEDFIESLKILRPVLLGNSLGGHLALMYALRHSNNVHSMVLCGSSGLYENTSAGVSFPRRGSYEYIKSRVIDVFYDPIIVSEAFIQEIFDITKSIPKCLRVVMIAKSAQRHNMSKDLCKVHVPTLLVWGLNDKVTPPDVAHEFHTKLPNSSLKFIDKCSHVPMMEHPKYFNQLSHTFIEAHTSPRSIAVP